MRKLELLLVIISIMSFGSCKKGCTDPYAENYNPKKEKDNGSCNVYDHVVLNSVRVDKIPEYNELGYAWDAGYGNDLDADNTYPDLFLTFSADNGYSLVPNTYWPTVDPNNVNIEQQLTPTLSLSEWHEGGFWVYFYEIDYPFEQEFIDSVFIDPFDYGANTNRFKDSLPIIKGNVRFTAFMDWYL